MVFSDSPGDHAACMGPGAGCDVLAQSLNLSWDHPLATHFEDGILMGPNEIRQTQTTAPREKIFKRTSQ
jgi:hypothetical protein